MRPLIGWAKISDKATITGSTAETGKPLSSLQKKQPKQIWRNSGGGKIANINLEIPYTGEANTFNTVALISTNASRFATWRIGCASTEAGVGAPASAAPNATGTVFGGCLELAGGIPAAHSFASSGSLASYTLSVRARVTTIRACGIVKFSNASSKVEIVMDGSGFILVNNQGGNIMSSSGTPWAAYEWHTVLVTVSGSNAALYIDGIEVDTYGSAGAVTIDAATVCHNVTNTLLGAVDDVQFWTRGFSATEALADFHRGGNVIYPATSLHSYYTFDGVVSNYGTIGGSMTINSAFYRTGGRLTASPWVSMTNVAGVTRRSALWFYPIGLNPNLSGSSYIRIDIDDMANTDTAVEAGRLVVGNFFSFRQDYPGTLPSFADGTQTTLTQGGHTAIEAHTPVPFASVNMRSYSEDEMMVYAWDLMQQRGGSKDVLYVRDPDPANVWRENGMVYGLLQPGQSITIPEYGIYEFPFQITGLI